MSKEVVLKATIDTEDLAQKFLNHELSNPLVLKMKRVCENVKAPHYATTHSACFDIYNALDSVKEVVAYDQRNNKQTLKVTKDVEKSYVIVEPFTRALIPTGFIFEIPEDYSLRIHSRSSTALKLGSTLANAQAIIDGDYREQSYIMVYNVSSIPLHVSSNERLAQGEIVPVYRCQFEEVEELGEIETNRTGGVGSTGK